MMVMPQSNIQVISHSRLLIPSYQSLTSLSSRPPSAHHVAFLPERAGLVVLVSYELIGKILLLYPSAEIVRIFISDAKPHLLRSAVVRVHEVRGDGPVLPCLFLPFGGKMPEQALLLFGARQI